MTQTENKEEKRKAMTSAMASLDAYGSETEQKKVERGVCTPLKKKSVLEESKKHSKGNCLVRFGKDSIFYFDKHQPIADIRPKMARVEGLTFISDEIFHYQLPRKLRRDLLAKDYWQIKSRLAGYLKMTKDDHWVGKLNFFEIDLKIEYLRINEFLLINDPSLPTHDIGLSVNGKEEEDPTVGPMGGQCGDDDYNDGEEELAESSGAWTKKATRGRDEEEEESVMEHKPSAKYNRAKMRKCGDADPSLGLDLYSPAEAREILHKDIEKKKRMEDLAGDDLLANMDTGSAGGYVPPPPPPPLAPVELPTPGVTPVITENELKNQAMKLQKELHELKKQLILLQSKLTKVQKENEDLKRSQTRRSPQPSGSQGQRRDQGRGHRRSKPRTPEKGGRSTSRGRSRAVDRERDGKQQQQQQRSRGRSSGRSDSTSGRSRDSSKPRNGSRERGRDQRGQQGRRDQRDWRDQRGRRDKSDQRDQHDWRDQCDQRDQRDQYSNRDRQGGRGRGGSQRWRERGRRF